MPNLTVVIPDSLASTPNDAVARRTTSSDSVVSAALSQYFQTGRHRAYQISTSATRSSTPRHLVPRASESIVQIGSPLSCEKRSTPLDPCLSASTWTSDRM